MDELSYAFRVFLAARGYRYYAGQDGKVPLFEESRMNGQRFFGFHGICEDMRVHAQAKTNLAAFQTAYEKKISAPPKEIPFWPVLPNRIVSEEEDIQYMEQAIDHLTAKCELLHLPKLKRTVSCAPSDLAKDPWAECVSCNGCGHCTDCFLAMEKHFTPKNEHQYGFPNFSDYTDDDKMQVMSSPSDHLLVRDQRVWKHIHNLQ